MSMYLGGKKKPDFIGKVSYLSTEQGGRVGYAASGYRPQIHFSFEKMVTSCEQIFIGKDSVEPGETIKAEMTMLSPEIFTGKLYKGIEFELKEGPRTVATGVIEKILNLKLVKKQ